MNIDPQFIYFTWDRKLSSKEIIYKGDHSSAQVVTSIGSYKNTYGNVPLGPNNVYVWSVQILRGTYFKIGVINQLSIPMVKRGFSDIKDGFAFFSTGKLRNGTNGSPGDIQTEMTFKRGFGPGDRVTVKFDSIKGELLYSLNGDDMQLAFSNEDFKKGGYLPAVGALLEGSKFRLCLPTLSD